MPIPISYSYRNLLARRLTTFLTATTMALGLAVSLAVGLLAGILPAWQASRVQIAAALRKVG